MRNESKLAAEKVYSLIGEMRDNILQSFLKFILHEVGDRYFESPASRRHHHAFIGGLAYHSAYAAELGLKIANHYNDMGIKVNRDLVVAGILLHDIGKIDCYEWNPDYVHPAERPEPIKGPGSMSVIPAVEPKKGRYEHTVDGTMIHHIPIGFELITRLADDFNESRERPEHRIDKKKLRKIQHIILSHHGRRAWSSPVIPQFLEAFIVHSVEMLDGYVDKFNDGKTPDTIYDGVNY